MLKKLLNHLAPFQIVSLVKKQSLQRSGI